jgi:hypothetical protein
MLLRIMVAGSRALNGLGCQFAAVSPSLKYSSSHQGSLGLPIGKITRYTFISLIDDTSMGKLMTPYPVHQCGLSYPRYMNSVDHR